MVDEPKYDLGASSQVLKLDGEPNFPPEVLEQKDYSHLEWAPEYKESFIWCFDVTLAVMLDMGLTGIMGHEFTYPPEGIERARNIFREYVSEGGSSFNDFEILGSEKHQDLMWALEWLKENFARLWT